MSTANSDLTNSLNSLSDSLHTLSDTVNYLDTLTQSLSGTALKEAMSPSAVNELPPTQRQSPSTSSSEGTPSERSTISHLSLNHYWPPHIHTPTPSPQDSPSAYQTPPLVPTDTNVGDRQTPTAAAHHSLDDIYSLLVQVQSDIREENKKLADISTRASQEVGEGTAANKNNYPRSILKNRATAGQRLEELKTENHALRNEMEILRRQLRDVRAELGRNVMMQSMRWVGRDLPH